jgi:threonine dehydrogenase-like Zn-dependent dehydrogenase
MWYHNRLGSRCKTIWRQCVASGFLTSGFRARAFNAAEGSTVAVFGCGCVGLSCINAAKLVEASRVIAIDVNPAKEEWARKFGATDFINPRQLPKDKRIQDHLIELTDGGLDFTFDATGNVSRAPPPALHDATFDNPVSFSLRLMLCGQRLRHAIKVGASRPSLVSQRPERRFPHDRKFDSIFFFLFLSKSLSMVM